MQEVFERIIEKLKEISIFMTTCDGYGANCVSVGTIEEIVKQEAEKYNNGWIPCSERLPEKNGYYYVTQIVKSISTGKKIAIEKAHVEFSEGKWRRAKHLEVIAWLDIEPYQPKGE